jgi:hypothetical protein
MPVMLQAPPPQWVDCGKTNDRGLDLLGLRSPVQKIGNSFLDGVTTITPVIRYLSFRALASYCYVQARLPNNWKTFRNYAESMEAAIAYGNLLVGVKAKGLLGTDNASNYLTSPDEKFVLKDLVKIIGINIYAGVSDQLKISFSSPTRVPGLFQERGVPLAKAVSKSFENSELGQLFLEGRTPETATRRQLEEFGQCVRIDRLESDERDLLVNILIPPQPAGDEMLRFMTYTSLLALANIHHRIPTEKDLFKNAIWRDERFPETLFPVLDGWLIYLIRDQLAVVHECALNEINSDLERKSLESRNLYSASEVIASILSQEDEIYVVLKELKLIGAGESINSLSFRNIQDRLLKQTENNIYGKSGLYRWKAGVNELDIIENAFISGAGALALLPIAWLLAIRRLDHQQLDTFPLNLLSYQGWARLGIKEVLLPSIQEFYEKDFSFLEVVTILAYRAADQHLRIAWSRFSRDPKKLVAVLISDGERWAFRNGFEAGETASRISQTVGWLEQLELINENGLTSDGQTILNRAVSTLSEIGGAN